MAARSANAVKRFIALLEELRTIVESGAGPATVLEAVLERTGYLAELQASTDPQDETRVENLQELVAVAREFEQEPRRGEPRRRAPSSDFLEQVALVADADQIPDEDEDGSGVVTLMTLHTAKGLEFPVVFLTGLEDGVFPHMRALGETKELEEERRLAYVGITRARERLYLTRSTMRSAWGQPSYNPPSRFLEEIPDQHLRVEAHGRRRCRPRRRPGRPAVAVSLSSSRSRSAAPAGLAASRRGATKDRPVVALAVGDRVTHDTFGLGTVVGGEGQRATNAEATIDFGDDEAEAAAAAVRAGGEAVAGRSGRACGRGRGASGPARRAVSRRRPGTAAALRRVEAVAAQPRQRVDRPRRRRVAPRSAGAGRWSCRSCRSSAMTSPALTEPGADLGAAEVAVPGLGAVRGGHDRHVAVGAVPLGAHGAVGGGHDRRAVADTGKSMPVCTDIQLTPAWPK